MAPSQLKQLKASLSSAGLIGPQKSKKQKAADQQRSDTRTVATKRTAALRSIRDQFNPYEVRSLTSRAPKHDVLRGISAARGSKARMITRPSQTKTLGEETRRRTLLVEMQNRHRVGGTTDQRFGDREADLGQRDLSQRNPSHQKRHTNNSSLFDLEGSEDDQDQMTHLGQRLPTAENDLVGYDDNEGPASLAFARPDRDERSGLKRKRSSDSIVAEQDMFTIKKSKNEVMKEVIAKSKLYKYERQQAKDEDEDVREELDRQLPDLLAAFSQGQAPVAGSDSRVRIDKSEQEYDEQVRQLAYDMRSMPTQKSKTEEEKGQERREHLQKLEEQRQARMRGEEPERVGKEDQDEDGLEDEDPTIFDGLGPGLSTHPMSNFLEDEDEFEIDTDLVEMEDLSEAEELEKSAFKTGDTHLDGMKSHRSVQASTLATIAPDETLDGFTPDPSSANAQQRITPIACPQDLPSLVALVKKAGKNGLLPTIQQIRLQYQAGSAETSSKQLAGFASLLVEYLLYHLAHYNTSPASDVDGLIRHLHSFAKTFPLEVAAPFRNWLTQILKRHPPLLIGEDIVAMKALGSIFPPSDHFHPLITPALLTMARFLEHCSVFPEDDCGAGTFISACCLDYQRIAKRYMPEVMAYFSCRLGPRAIERDDDFLDFEHIVPVLRQAANLWHDHPAFVEIFQPICDLLGLIVDPPAEMQDLGRELSTMVEQARLTRRPLTLHHHKPLAIKTAIPKFEAHFEPRRAFDPDQDRREASKLKAEYKRERKGAIRELRKDANFISREGLKEKKLKDAAYEKKYKRLVAEIQGEEGHEKNLYERDKRMRKKGGRDTCGGSVSYFECAQQPTERARFSNLATDMRPRYNQGLSVGSRSAGVDSQGGRLSRGGFNLEVNLLWNESAGHFWGVSMNLAVSPSTPPSRQEHRSPRPKRQKISHEDGDYHPGTPPSKSEKTSPSSTINFTSDHRKVPPKSESDLTVPQDEHLQPSQTDLESALPDVRTDKEAIRDYEASRAAASSPPTDRADRISSRRWDPGKSSIYVDAFNLALDTVLNEEKHLFSLNELAVFDYWWNLNYEAQYLYVRLFLRKTAAWHRISKLGYYGDIADMPSAVATLWDIRSLPEDETPTLVFAGDLDPPLDDVLESKMWFAEDSTTHITTLEAASALLTLDELKEIAKDVKARGKNKGELLTAFRRTSKSQSGLHGLALDRNDSGDTEASGAVTPLESEELSNRPSGPIISLESASRAVNRDQLFLEKIKKRIGPCIRLSAPILKLFERVHLVFYRSTEWTEKSLTTLILARILKRNFPEYIVSRSADIFPSRESLLEFEASMRIQFAVDNLLEFSGVPNKVAFPRVLEIFEQVLPRWRVIVREEQLKEERVYDTGEGAYLRRFSPAWVYTRIVHKGTYVLGRQHEHAREHAILTELLAQRLFHFSRRGAWYQRKALLEEHYMADLQPTCGRGAEAQKRYYRNLALDTCDAALQDPDCHVIYHYDLQKRIGKLERQLCIAKRFQHDFGHVTLTKPTERTFEGVQIRRRPSSRSRSRSRSVGGRRRSGSGAGTGAQVALSRSNSHSGPPPADTKPPPSTSRSPSGPGPTATGSGGGNGNGGKTVWLDPLEHAPCSVEAMCLSRYRQLGYRGFHAEGSLLRTLFAYLLYDVLFAYAPNVFQTACQTCPLDLHTDAFYPTRAGELEKRFAEIANGEGRGILRRVWEEHGGRRTCVVGLSWEFELQDLLEIVGCFRGEQLAGICKVMAQEYRERGGGVPDLFLWRLHGDGDGEEKETGDEGGGTMGEILFAEVKSENDRLSDTQRLWIHVLSSNGIAVELCNAVASEVVDEEEVAGRIKALRIG